MDKVILIIFIVSTALIIGYIFFGGKKKIKSKKKKDEQPKGEKKIEQVIKSEKKEVKEEKKEEVPKIEMPEQASSGFKIIRKQSKVKINKRALQDGSRNPSVTKVFDKSGRSQFDIDAVESIDREQENDFIQEESIGSNNVGRFGARDVDYLVVNKGNEF